MKIQMVNREDASSFHVLIPAAGTGERAETALPKQYCRTAGKPLLRHTIEIFLGLQGLKSLRVAIHPDHADLYREAVQGLDLATPVTGGKTRKISVYNALNSFSNVGKQEKILIHDAARPYVSGADILKVVKTLDEKPAVSLAVPVPDTLFNPGDQTYTSRVGLWSLQTPQGFHFGILKDAHTKFQNDNSFTDDTGLVQAMGLDITLVEGSPANRKITTSRDIEDAQRYFPLGFETRTGSGFDVHAFAPDGDHVIIGGIKIPHTQSLLGHSDADVALHALTDALLGTIGAGDIGLHFPPSDPKWKGADSAIFLSHACGLIAAHGGCIVHADLTILCEAPKIAPYREKMQARIAEILRIAPDRVSMKATTTEGLGFIGRHEGIAAQALATVRLPAR